MEQLQCPRKPDDDFPRLLRAKALIKTTLTYDIAGNVKSITDQKSHATTMVYSDPNNTYAHPTQQTNALSQVTTAQYDLGTGKITSVTDPNSVTTTYAYNDPLDRPTQVIAASGTSVETRTAFTYPSTTQVTQKQDQNHRRRWGAAYGHALRKLGTADRDAELRNCIAIHLNHAKL